MTWAVSWRRMSTPSGVSRVMIATAASWSINVARSRGRPSILTATGASLAPGRERLVVARGAGGLREQQLFINFDRPRAHDIAGIAGRDLRPGAPGEGRARILIERQRLVDRERERRGIARRHQPAG